MNKAFSPIEWQNEPSVESPINADNLNRIENGLNEVDNRVVQFDVTKANVTDIQKSIVNVEFDEDTGEFRFTRKDGSSFRLDTKLEKLVLNWRFDADTQTLYLILEDGSEMPIDLSALIVPNEFIDSDTIYFTVMDGGKVTASIKNGSITGEKLEPNYLANITLQASKADKSAQEASESAIKSEEHAKEAEKYSKDWIGSLLPQGKIRFESIPIQGMREGQLYDIVDGFVSDNRFADGAGYSYPAGTNIFWNKDGKWDVIYGKLTREITQAEYDSLSDSEKLNGTVYYIKDSDLTLDKATDTIYGVVIVDKVMSEESENPVQNKIVQGAISAVDNKVKQIQDDYVTSKDLEGIVIEENDPTVPAWAKENTKPSYTASEVGADSFGSANIALKNAKAYTDQKISDLIGGAPSTLDTLKEIADAMEEHAEVVDALEESIGTKLNKTGDSENLTATFTRSETRSNITSGEKHSVLFGKISKFFSDLKSVAFSADYNELSNRPTSLPASDVYSWAKSSNKPTYNKEEVGLGNVPDVTTNDQTPTFIQSSNRINVSSGDTLSTLFGKISKWFADLKTVAFSGSYNDLSDKPTIPRKTSQLENDVGYKTTDNNTTYQLTKKGSDIVLVGSDGSETVVIDDNTTYTLDSFGITANASELNHVDGVTSNIQEQLNSKAPYVILTQAEYDALPSDKNSNNVVYFIRDKEV